MEEVAPPKRGRGRPPGSLNKKTLARQAELARAEEETPPDEFVLDVEFDEEQLPVPEELPEELPEPPRLSRQRSGRSVAEGPGGAELPEPLTESPRLSRQRSVRMNAPHSREALTAPHSREALTAPQSREALGRVSESHVSAPTIVSPRPAKRQRVKPVAKTVAKPVEEPAPPPNYLEVLKHGLAIAKASHKAEKVARYDSFFRM